MLGKTVSSPRKTAKKSGRTIGNRYGIGILMSLMRRLIGIVCCFAQIENIKRQALTYGAIHLITKDAIL